MVFKTSSSFSAFLESGCLKKTLDQQQINGIQCALLVHFPHIPQYTVTMCYKILVSRLKPKSTLLLHRNSAKMHSWPRGFHRCRTQPQAIRHNGRHCTTQLTFLIFWNDRKLVSPSMLTANTRRTNSSGPLFLCSKCS